jgi:glycosyltransferase involved in cell wall biosynthesis
MRFLERHGIRHRVKLVRRMLELPELVREYSTARAAVVPSFFEGFGFPASEAMSCGLPVIANAAGALPEVVGTDGVAGRLVPPRDPRAMASAILDVLSDPERTQAMGRAARQRIEHVFQWSDAAEGLVRVFEETVRAAHRRSRAA